MRVREGYSTAGRGAGSVARPSSSRGNGASGPGGATHFPAEARRTPFALRGEPLAEVVGGGAEVGSVPWPPSHRPCRRRRRAGCASCPGREAREAGEVVGELAAAAASCGGAIRRCRKPTRSISSASVSSAASRRRVAVSGPSAATYLDYLRRPRGGTKALGVPRESPYEIRRRRCGSRGTARAPHPFARARGECAHRRNAHRGEVLGEGLGHVCGEPSGLALRERDPRREGGPGTREEEDANNFVRAHGCEVGMQACNVLRFEIHAAT